MRGCLKLEKLLEEYHNLETEQTTDNTPDEMALEFDLSPFVDPLIDENYKARFEQAMDDDFNTPVAIAVLFDLARELNKAKENEPQKVTLLATSLKLLAALLGLLQHNPDAFLKGNEDGDNQIEQQIQVRIDAKKAKDWATADKIRNDLKASGIILEDAPDGTTSWRRE